MTGALLGVAAVVLLGGSGVAAAALLRVRRFAELLLAVYVIAFAEIVVLTLALSLFGALTRASLLGAAAVVFAIVASLWLLAGSPPPPALPAGAFRALGAPLLVLAGVVSLAVGYVTALVVATAPNGWDQQAYHLTRVAFWLQSERVGYLEHAYDERLNFNPVHGELALAFVLGVTREEALTGLVQVAAALACALGIFALARRVGLDRREALFGALLFLTLPVVLLQAATTKNDLVLCAFLIAAAVFVLGETKGEIALAGLATALAVGTKFTGVHGVLLVLGLALLARPRERLLLRLAGIGAGTLVGSYWLAVNAVETGDLRGDESEFPNLSSLLDPAANVMSVYALFVESVDLSGAEGKDILLYLAAAAVVAVVVVASGRGRSALVWAGIAAGVVASPLLLHVLHVETRDRLPKVHQVLGRPDAFLPFENSHAWSPTTASAGDSWYGVVGLLLALGVGVAAIVLVRRRELPTVALVPAAAPLVLVLLLAATLTYHPFQGRFVAFGVALSASLWGLVLRVRPVAWAVVGLAATTALLVLVHAVEKPSGVRLLDGPRAPSAWTMERWELQANHANGLGRLYRFFDEEVPAGDPVALALTTDMWGYHVFGPRLERHVELVPFGSDANDVDARWLLAGYRRVGEIGVRCWRRVLTTEQGAIFERRDARGCPAAER